MIDYLIYLLQVSACHTAFYLLYRFCYEKLAWFQWNRVYILLTTLISFIIPLFDIGVWEGGNYNLAAINFSSIRESFTGAGTAAIESPQLPNATDFPVLPVSLFAIYLAGTVYYAFHLGRGIFKLNRLVKSGQISDRDQYKIVHVSEGAAFFSFLNYIFINRRKCSLNESELKKVLVHEKEHISQKHTYDLFFLEIANILCWFNPFIRMIRKALVQVHEYQADKIAAGSSESPEEYSKIILKLSGTTSAAPMAHQFSFINIKNRINMLYHKNYNPMQKFRFVLVVPVLALLTTVFSFTEKQNPTGNGKPAQEAGGDLIINSISWEGNELYSDQMLSKVMEVSPGDMYDRKAIDKNISFSEEGDDIGALYMDRGYLYFTIAVEEKIDNEKVDLTFRVHEGVPVRINDIIIKGNSTIKIPDILKLVTLKKGDLFSRSKLVESQKNLAESGWFVPGDIFIQPIPLEDPEKMDLEFTVKEKH